MWSAENVNLIKPNRRDTNGGPNVGWISFLLGIGCLDPNPAANFVGESRGCVYYFKTDDAWAVAAFVLSFAAVPFQSADAAAFHQGESGPEVAAIQEKLLMEGYDIGIPDGVYGERTVDAIKKYQASMGLEVDGIIGWFHVHEAHGKRMPSMQDME